MRARAAWAAIAAIATVVVSSANLPAEGHFGENQEFRRDFDFITIPSGMRRIIAHANLERKNRESIFSIGWQSISDSDTYSWPISRDWITWNFFSDLGYSSLKINNRHVNADFLIVRFSRKQHSPKSQWMNNAESSFRCGVICDFLSGAYSMRMKITKPTYVRGWRSTDIREGTPYANFNFVGAENKRTDDISVNRDPCSVSGNQGILSHVGGTLGGVGSFESSVGAFHRNLYLLGAVAAQSSGGVPQGEGKTSDGKSTDRYEGVAIRLQKLQNVVKDDRYYMVSAAIFAGGVLLICAGYLYVTRQEPRRKDRRNPRNGDTRENGRIDNTSRSYDPSKHNQR